MIANNFEEFTEKVLHATVDSFNNTESGRDLTCSVLNAALEINPNLTPEEWEKIKEQFLVFAFFEGMKVNNDLHDEFAGHLYTELRKE